MKKKPRFESGRCREAFEVYFAMGEDRSVSKVAQEIGVSKTQVSTWSSTFGWVNRARKLEEEANAKSLSTMVTDMAFERRNFIGGMANGLEALQNKFKDIMYLDDEGRYHLNDNIKVGSLDDLDKLSRIIERVGKLLYGESITLKLDKDETIENTTDIENVKLIEELPEDDERTATVLKILQESGAIKPDSKSDLEASDVKIHTA